jgi:hypothetical protein
VLGLVTWGLDLKARWIDAAIKSSARRLLTRKLKEVGLVSFVHDYEFELDGGALKLTRRGANKTPTL